MAPQRLRQAVVAADQLRPDAVHGVVDVPGDGRHQRGRLRQQRLLGGRPHRAEDGVGAAQLLLQLGQGLRPGAHRVEVVQQVAEVAGIAVEGGGVAQQQVAEVAVHVVHPEHRAVDGLVQAHPQADVVGVQRPLPGEVVHVGQGDQHRLADGAGHRQHVAAQGLLGQPAHHGAGGQRQHGRADHPGEAGQHGRHRVVGLVVGVGAQAGGDRLAQRAEQLAVVVEGAVRPADPVDDLHPQRRARRRLQAGGVGHPQLGHPHQLLHRDAVGGVDVGLRDPAGADGPGHLAGLAGAGRRSLEHSHQVAQHRDVPRLARRAEAAPASQSSGPGRVVGLAGLAQALQALQAFEALEGIVGSAVCWRIAAHGGIVWGWRPDCPARAEPPGL